MFTPYKHHMRGLLFLLLLLCLCAPLWGDRWMMARPFDTASGNGKFVASITPGGPKRPTLELFSVHEGKRVLEWRAELSNRVAPFEVLVTDDGRHAITLDNHAGVGFGDDVVAIYAKSGLLRKYSLEQIAGDALKPHIGKHLRTVQLTNFPHSAGSRWWRNESIMVLDGSGDEARFAIWPAWAQRWYVWKLSDGSIEQLGGDAQKNGTISDGTGLRQSWQARQRMGGRENQSED